METRARYVLIGAFTLAGLVGALAFLLWFAQVSLDRRFATYDISFGSVSGLGVASGVRFSGLPVGQVTAVRLAPEGDGTILVRIEVDAATPVRADSLATIEAQGVTGVSFVAISAGTPEAPLLVPSADGAVSRITASRSVLQSLAEDAPDLLAEALVIARETSALLSGENRGRVERILVNVEGASDDFAQSLEDFSQVAGSVSEFATQIDDFNATLAEMTDAMTGTLGSADEALASITLLADESRAALARGTGTLDGIEGAAVEARRYVADDLGPATREVGATAAALRGRIAALGEEATAMIAAATAAGEAATARLGEARATLAAADAAIARTEATMTAMGTASDDFDALVTGDGAALVAETRAVVAVASEAVTDLPAILAGVRDATATLSRVATDVGSDLTGATGRLDGLADGAEAAMAQATAAFAHANDTLAALDGALVTGDRALAAADRAFAGADRVINEEVGPVAEALRATLGDLDAAVAGVADDIPAIAADLRAAGAAARDAFATLDRVATASGASVEGFAATALPAYARLAEEARALVATLDAIASRVERDPARFLLSPDAPEFRR